MAKYMTTSETRLLPSAKVMFPNKDSVTVCHNSELVCKQTVQKARTLLGHLGPIATTWLYLKPNLANAKGCSNCKKPRVNNTRHIGIRKPSLKGHCKVFAQFDCLGIEGTLLKFSSLLKAEKRF